MVLQPQTLQGTRRLWEGVGDRGELEEEEEEEAEVRGREEVGEEKERE